MSKHDEIIATIIIITTTRIYLAIMVPVTYNIYKIKKSVDSKVKKNISMELIDANKVIDWFIWYEQNKESLREISTEFYMDYEAGIFNPSSNTDKLEVVQDDPST